LSQALRKGRQWLGVEDKLPALMAEIRSILSAQQVAGVVVASEITSPHELTTAEALTLPALETAFTDGAENRLPLEQPARLPLPAFSSGSDNGHTRAANGAVRGGDGHAPGATESQRPDWNTLAELALKAKAEKAAARRERAAKRRKSSTGGESSQGLTLLDLLEWGVTPMPSPFQSWHRSWCKPSLVGS
jgi:hypothetical protein